MAAASSPSAGGADSAGNGERVSSEVLRDLLEYLAEGLVDDPEAVSVEQFEEDDGTLVLELSVGPTTTAR